MSKSSALLHIQAYGDVRQPVLVFIHGFLGCGKDWMECIARLSNEYYCVTLDLPGHGNSSNIDVSCLAQSVTLIEEALSVHAIKDYILIGYSMGARHIAYGAAEGMFSSMRACVLEGANLGGLTAQQREERLASDRHWAQRFSAKPLREVLEDWYLQPVFASLDKEQRSAVINRRCAQNEQAGAIHHNLGQMLLASSLATQGDLRAKFRQLAIPKVYIVGEHDTKFRCLGAEYQLPVTCISSAGHNCHIENPAGFALAVDAFINTLKN